jgi:outer membrane receptor protein involved in Fe transport
VQDDWKVNDRLTLNLGLRYEFIATPYEEQNGFTWPDFGAPGGALYIANAKTAAAIRRRESSRLHRPDSTFLLRAENAAPDRPRRVTWAPRLGFAYRVFGDDKTSPSRGLWQVLRLH